jgi:hypothetical protein
VDLIGKSVKKTLEVNAANQKDVSGFVDIYTNMNATKEGIFSQIPGYKPNSGANSQLLIGPDGKQYNVPSDQVDAFIKAGGHK